MNIWSRFLFILLGILIGFIFFAVIPHYHELKFDPTYTAGNLTQALATIVAAIIVAAYFQRAVQTDRKEKDILLRHVDLVLEELANFERFKDGGVVSEIAASLKRLSMKSRAINELLVALNYSRAICGELLLDGKIRAFRKLSTDTPVREIEAAAGDPNLNSTVRNGIIQFNNERRLQLDSSIQKLKLTLYKVQIEINRA